MKNINLIILENEEEYGRRLAGYIGGHEGSPFVIQLFLEHASEQIFKAEADIFLVTSSLWDRYRTRLKDSSVLILDEDGSVDTADTVYKYQSAENIYRTLIDFSVEKSKKRIDCGGYVKDGFELKLVFMPEPGVETKERFRSWLEEESEHRKILYINMEQIPHGNIGTGNDVEGQKGFSELIYYLKQYRENIGARLSAISVSGVYDYIIPAQLISETYELSGDEWQRLFDALKDETGYELVLLDYGCCVPHIEVLKRCSGIYLFSCGSEWETQVSDRFRLILERVGGTELSSKLTEIR